MRQARTGPGERMRRMWERLTVLPGGRWLFSRALGWMVPYSGTIRASVLELEPGRARVQLRDRRGVRNHLRSIHAVALANLGELCTGLALNCGLSRSIRAILVGFSMRYLKKARGMLTAECRCEVPSGAAEQEITLSAKIHDAQGDVVAEAEALWLIGPQPASATRP